MEVTTDIKEGKGERILVTGGSGYLGQFLLVAFLEERNCIEALGYTYRTEPPPSGLDNVSQFRCDITSGSSIRAILHQFRPTVIVHTAAMSSPAICERNPDLAMKTNCPGQLLEAASSLAVKPFIIYTSTDQVYSGKPTTEGRFNNYKANSTRKFLPVNVYGASKAAFERALEERWSHYVVLRLSNILGPPSPLTGAKKFLQFLEDRFDPSNYSQLCAASADRPEPLGLFSDEIRSFVHVSDVVRAICEIASVAPYRWRNSKLCNRVYNFGGPDPLSRVDLAQALVRARQWTPFVTLPVAVRGEHGRVNNQESDLISDATAQSQLVVRLTKREDLEAKLGYKSPLDISMNSGELQHALGWNFRPLVEALVEVNEAPAPVIHREATQTTAAHPEPRPRRQRLVAIGFVDFLLLLSAIFLFISLFVSWSPSAAS